MSSQGDSIAVLNVDDDPDLRDLVATYLERVDSRLSVETAASPADASERIVQGDVDCVVSDYDMPQQDGLEFLESVRERYPDLPFILYTGKGSEEVASEAISAGATDYLRKDSGTENYELLANRVVNAVEKTRSKGRASRFKRIAELVRTIQSALVSATSRADIDDAVCETLAEADPYQFAWIGDYDAETGTVRPRAAAGDEVGDLEPFVAVDEASGGPIAAAIENQRVAAIQNLSSDDEVPPASTSFDGTYRSVAAVPLVYDETRYGVLNLYADRAGAFGPEERELLGELGETIAHALNRVALQRQYEDQYRELFEDAPVMFAFTRVEDDELVIEDCNRQFAETLGHDAAALRGRRIADLYTEESQWELREGGGYDRALAGEFVAEERELLTADGDRVTTILRASPRRNEDGDIVGTNSLYVDVTQRERMEEVDQHRKRLRQIVDLIPDFLFAKNESGEFILANEAIAEALGTTPEEMVGKTDADFVAEEQATGFREDDRAVIRSNEPVHVEEELTDGAGNTRVLETRKIPFTVAGTDTDAVLCYSRDITDLKERERVLREIYRVTSDPDREFQEKVDTLLAIGQDVLDVEYATLSHLDGDQFVVSVANAPDDRVRVGDAMDRSVKICNAVVESGESIAYNDLPEQAPDIAARVEEPFADVGCYVAAPVLLDDEPFGAVSFYDAERREEPFSEWQTTLVDLLGQWVTYELGREHLTEGLERKNEQLAEFAGIVSHDLRNPLNVAQGQLELAGEEVESAHLDEVARAHERMNHLIDDILALAQEGDSVTDPEPVSLPDFVEACWRNVDTRDATLEVDTDRTVLADDGRLKRLFENLMRNAVEHGSTSPDSQPRQDAVEQSSTSPRSQSAPEDAVEHATGQSAGSAQEEPADASTANGASQALEGADDGDVTVRVGDLADGFFVEDDGPGIDEAHRDDVFESGYSTNADGSGLGLSIVAKVADAHGWAVELGTGTDGGARFEFSGVRTPRD